jgi:hypothetical protein
LNIASLRIKLWSRLPDGALYIAKRAGRDRVASTLQLMETIGTAAE